MSQPVAARVPPGNARHYDIRVAAFFEFASTRDLGECDLQRFSNEIIGNVIDRFGVNALACPKA